LADVFISYSRRDKGFVVALNDALVARGKDPWVDWEDIPASADWFTEIQRGIDAADAFLYVLSPDSAGSEVCGKELDYALSRNKRVLPILRRMVDPESVRAEAAALNWVYVRSEDEFEAAVDTLVRAIDTDLEHVRAHTRWSQAAIDWEHSDRNGSRLLRGTELDEAERWLTAAAGKSPAPTELQSELVQESRDGARRRQRMLFASVTVALAVAVVLSVVAVIQRSNAVHQSKVATARELAAQAQNHYETDPELSVLLARRAAETDPGPATTEALRQALRRSAIRHTFRYEGDSPQAAIWHPDGRRLLIARGDDKADLLTPGAKTEPLTVQQAALSTQVSFSRSGERFALGGGSAHVFDTDSGRSLRRAGDRGALHVVLDPAGERVFWVDLEGVVRSTDVATGRDTITYRSAGDAHGMCLALSPDGEILVECSTPDIANDEAARRVRFWDAASGRVLGTRRLAARVSNVDFSPDGRRFAVAMTGGDASGVVVLDSRTAAVVKTFAGGSTDVGFNVDGTKLAYTSAGIEVGHVYDFQSKSEQLLIGHTGTLQTIEFSPTGLYVITTSFDETARVWDPSTGSLEQLLAGHEATVSAAHFNEDETSIATTSGDGTVRVWASPKPKASRSIDVAGTQLSGIDLSPDGSRALVNERSAGRILDVRTLEVAGEIRPPAGQIFVGMAHSPAGSYIGALSGREDPEGDIVSTDSAHVYDPRSGRRLAELSTPGSPIVNAAFAGKSGRIATMSQNGQVDEWDATTGRHRWTVDLKLPPNGVSYTDDGSLLAVVHPGGEEDDPVTIDLVREGKRIRRIKGPEHKSQIVTQGAFVFLGVAFSPDGRELSISGHDRFVSRYDVATGRHLGDVPTKETFSTSVKYSHDGRLLAAQNPNSAQLYSLPASDYLRDFQHVSTGLYRFSAGDAGVVYATFSDDDAVLLTSGDVRVRAWRTATGEPLFDVFGAYAAMTPDARRIVAGTAKRISVFTCELCANREGLLATAARFTTRGFTRVERRVYLHED
jgi:WD40 repeat protein